MQKISKQQLAANLDRAIAHLPGEPVGMQGLNTLIYGWIKHKRYGLNYSIKVSLRDFLWITEVHELSEYAGYDLAF